MNIDITLTYSRTNIKYLGTERNILNFEIDKFSLHCIAD